jgi:hypothetical protein
LPPPPPPPCRKECWQGVVGQQPWETHQPMRRSSQCMILQVFGRVVLVYVQCLRFVFT